MRIDVNLIVCAAHHRPVRAEESPLELSRHQVAGDNAKGDAGSRAAEELLTPPSVSQYSLD